MFGRVVYVTANLRDSARGGFEPDLPEDCAFAEVASPHRRATWRLYECSLEPRSPVGWPGVEVVPDGVARVLRSARNNPLALSAARMRVLKELDGDAPVLIERGTFCRMVATALAESLEEIPESEIDFQIMPADPDTLGD